MQKLVDLTKAHGIKPTVVAYPLGSQIASGHRTNRQIWRTRYFLFNDFHAARITTPATRFP
jgi:hypothetical protein